MNNYNCKILKYTMLSIVLLAIVLPYFVIPLIIGGGVTYAWAFVFIECFLFILLLKNPKYIFVKIKELIKCKTSKVLFAFICSEIFLIIIHTILGDNSFFKPFIFLIYRFSYTLLPLFFGYLLLDYFKSKTIIKVIFCALYMIMLCGVFDFIIFYFDIDILKKLYFFLVNDRILLAGLSETKAFIGSLPRIQSTFVEPAFLAYFLNMHLPIIYNLSFSKYKIFENKFLNKFLKFSLPVLTWIVIIGMQSPIHLIFDILITIFYIIYKKKISIKTLFKYSIIFFCGSTVITTILYISSQSSDFIPIKRISIVLECISNFNILVFAEPSLATRIGTYSNELSIFLNHPIIGCGIGNFVDVFSKQISTNSPVLLTEELVIGHILGNRAVNATILYSSLAELGLFTTLLYYYFIYTLQKALRDLLPYLSGIEKDFISGYIMFLFLYIILSFYEAFFSYFWLEFGMLLGFVIIVKRRFQNAYINR